jgi:hypothetical protein
MDGWLVGWIENDEFLLKNIVWEYSGILGYFFSIQYKKILNYLIDIGLS